MTKPYRTFTILLAALLIVCGFESPAVGQYGPGIRGDVGSVLTDAELTRVMPTSFYFQGQNASTQLRNSAAARFGNRHVIVGMVDTSGYAADVRAKYEGFLITDTVIRINDKKLEIGAYGFGFSDDGKMQILNLAGAQILSVTTTNDGSLKRPRPLMMVESGGSIRLYSGKQYVTVTVK